MNLDNYQKQAKTTAAYPNCGDNIIYPTLGLLGECGEVCEKIKKLERDDQNIITDQRRNDIINEIGDVMWYIASICSEIKTDLNIIYEMIDCKIVNYTKNSDLKETAIQLVICAAETAKIILQWHRHQHKSNRQYPYYAETTNQLSYVIQCVNEIANQIHVSLDTICEMNLKKLSSRKKRNVIRGDGDER